MGLIDYVRDKKDSWNKRYEEQRTEKDEYDHKLERLKIVIQNSARER